MKGQQGAILAAALSAIVLAAGTVTFAQAQGLSEDAAVKAANEGFYAALSARDIGAMRKVWSPRADIRNINPRAKAADVGWEAIAKGIQGVFDSFAELHVSADDVQIRVAGSVAWVSNLERAQRKLKNGERSSGVNFATNVFEKQDGKWVLVHHHASPVAQ